MTRRLTVMTLAVLMIFTLIPVAPALAVSQTYVFSGPKMQLTFDTSLFDKVLTPETLEAEAEWLTGKGLALAEVKQRYEEDGVLLEAYDSPNSRVLVVSAIEDSDGRDYFDVNTQDVAMRKVYRQSHTNGTLYGLLGYKYDSSVWRNYGSNLARFLKLKYSLTVGGDLICRGYQRRTIRNGYTITLDMQVTGRKQTDADETLLDRMMSGLYFTEVMDTPADTCRLTLTEEPASETTSEKMTIAGKTEAGATVTATLISLTDSKTATFSAVANKSGKFSISMKFPSQGTFSLTVLATTTDGRTAQRSTSVMYQRDYIPLNFKTTVPAVLPEDSLTVSGTTVSGVKTQISVTGPTTMQKSTTSKSFKFTVDTSKEGTYQILITATKKGMSPRTVTFTAARTLTDAERLERAKKKAESVKYSALKSGISRYAGHTIVMTGYVMETRQTGDEWVVKLAINRSGSTYKDLIYVICKEDPKLEVLEHVRMYGTLSENTYVEVVEGSGTSEYPRFELLLFETMN